MHAKRTLKRTTRHWLRSRIVERTKDARRVGLYKILSIFYFFFIFFPSSCQLSLLNTHTPRKHPHAPAIKGVGGRKKFAILPKILPCTSTVVRIFLGPYKIYMPIFYCNKGGRGGNILRNIVGNKGGLGGGYCTIMCNNAPCSVSRTIFFFRHLHPSKIRNIRRPLTKANNKKIPRNTSKLLKNTSKSGGGVQ